MELLTGTSKPCTVDIKEDEGSCTEFKNPFVYFFLIQSVVWFQIRQLLLFQSVSFFLRWGIPSVILHQIGTEGNSFQLNNSPRE